MSTTVKSRNMLFNDASALVWEGSDAILYRAGTDAFGKPMYDISISAWSTWTAKPELYWKRYTNGHGAYGPDGIANLIIMAKEVNRQASLVVAHKDNIEDVIRVARAERINRHIIMDITGYYTTVETGYYLKGNHTGTVPI